MKNCLSKIPVVTGKAKQVNVTPDEEVVLVVANSSDSTGADAGRGKAVFAQCVACHSIDKGENKFGTGLREIYENF
jgi:cytochrome c2